MTEKEAYDLYMKTKLELANKTEVKNKMKKIAKLFGDSKAREYLSRLTFNELLKEWFYDSNRLHNFKFSIFSNLVY